MASTELEATIVRVPLQDVLPLDLRLAVALLALLSVPFALWAIGLLTRMLAGLQCWRLAGLQCWRLAKVRPDRPPHVSSVIPVLGHALELRRRGARYLHQLITNTRAEIFTIDVLFKRVLVVNPSLDRALAKHVHDTSLARVVSIFGQQSLELSDKAVRIIAQYDPRPVHSQLFAAFQGSATLADSAACYIHGRTQSQPCEQQVPIGQWLFDLVVGASAHALWGPQNPWGTDREFMRQFV